MVHSKQIDPMLWAAEEALEVVQEFHQPQPDVRATLLEGCDLIGCYWLTGTSTADEEDRIIVARAADIIRGLLAGGFRLPFALWAEKQLSRGRAVAEMGELAHRAAIVLDQLPSLRLHLRRPAQSPPLLRPGCEVTWIEHGELHSGRVVEAGLRQTHVQDWRDRELRVIATRLLVAGFVKTEDRDV